MEVDFAPDLTARYLQILSPALSMCDAIISSMGVDNHIAVVQVKHSDFIFLKFDYKCW